ncbi:DUF2975 domain-containing protein [uncultured Clostridium sp.]|jgi:hypothetical protein|uniref:DUF2975 domain-containing protein n=1 Tax=uncultured Clostridium sp. TaxID=59620 RepID=UPI00260AAB24|nr:DUF2975 domain-containing protein [uncultured Clostridium sp.]
MKKNFTTSLLNIVLIFGIIVTLLICLGAPFILGAVFKVQELPLDNTSMFYSILIVFYICAAPYIIALFKLRTLTGLVLKNTPFTKKSVNALRTIAICSFSELILFILGANIVKHMFDEFSGILLTPPIIIIGFMCILLGLMFITLAKLFNNAIELKEENDMTI